MKTNYTELREDVHQDSADAATVVALYAERDELRAELIELRARVELAELANRQRAQETEEAEEQNAKLVTALEEYGDHLPQRVGEDCLGPVWDSETKTLSYRPCVCGFDAALASVKGEPPRYGFNCEPGCPGCPNCEGTA